MFTVDSTWCGVRAMLGDRSRWQYCVQEDGLTQDWATKALAVFPTGITSATERIALVPSGILGRRERLGGRCAQ